MLLSQHLSPSLTVLSRPSILEKDHSLLSLLSSSAIQWVLVGPAQQTRVGPVTYLLDNSAL